MIEKFDPGRVSADLRDLVDSAEHRWAIMNQSRTIRSSVHVVKEINLILRALRHLELANGRETHLEQIAHLIDRPVEDVRRALALNEHIASPRTRRWKSIRAIRSPMPLPTITRSIPESLLQSNEVGGLVKHWVEQLPEKQRRVLERRYGLNGCEVSTLEEAPPISN